MDFARFAGFCRRILTDFDWRDSFETTAPTTSRSYKPGPQENIYSGAIQTVQALYMSAARPPSDQNRGICLAVRGLSGPPCLTGGHLTDFSQTLCMRI